MMLGMAAHVLASEPSRDERSLYTSSPFFLNFQEQNQCFEVISSRQSRSSDMKQRN
jgi:hypothetical protein